MAPIVNISATVISPGPRNSPGVVSAMTTPGRNVKLTSPRQDPMLIVRARFLQQDIAQEMPLRFASNELTVTIIPSFHVTSGSNITVTGLSGTLQADTRCLQISGPCTVLFFLTGNTSAIAILLGRHSAVVASSAQSYERVRVVDLDLRCTGLKQDCNESFCTPDFPEHLCRVNCRC